MSLSSEFAEMMNDSVTVYSQSTLDKYGKRTFNATGRVIKCRVEYDTALTRDNERRDVVSSGTVYVYGSAVDVTVDSKLLLPDGVEQPIIDVSHHTDETGAIHHTVIKFGR